MYWILSLFFYEFPPVVARGCSGWPAPTRAEKKIRRNLQRKFVSAPSTLSAPQADQGSIFKDIFCYAGKIWSFS